MKKEEFERKIAYGLCLHNGAFHLDDVTVAALVDQYNDYKLGERRLLENFVIHRTRDLKFLERFETAGIVADVGNGEFDHHQKNAKFRSNGVKYAATGLIWKQMGVDLIKLVCEKKDYVPSEEAVEWAAKMFDSNICQPIDNTDNFGPKTYPNPLSEMISSFNSEDIYDDDSQYQHFIDAVEIVEQMIHNSLEKYARQCKEYDELTKIINASEGAERIVLPKHFAPTLFIGRDSNVHYIAYPADNGKWNISALDSERWPILFTSEQMPGCTFVHPSKFLAVFDTKEHALAALVMA
jgi:uncharacterized UPF0160 family protein